MSTNSVAVKTGATAVTFTGGADQVFTPDGERVENGVRLIAAAVTDFYARPSCTIRTRSEKVVNGVVVKAKRWYTYSQPRLDAAGVLYYDVKRFEEEIHPSTSAADRSSDTFKFVSFLTTADLAAFRATGSLG